MNNLTIILIISQVLLFFTSSLGQSDNLCIGYHWTEEEGNLKMKEFSNLWNDKTSWETRANKIKENIKTGMKFNKMPDIEGGFNTEIYNTREFDGYIIENIRIESFPGFYITGNIYRPSGIKDKMPAVLSPHGHLKDKRLKEDVQYRCAVLARMGAFVIAYDMVGHGDSQQVDSHHIPIAMLLQTWNSKRVLDYLVSREDIDEDNIGITGGSGGATQTFLLTAIDERIAASVPCVQVSANFFGGCICESGMPIHKIDNFQTNNVEIAALCAPRPMLIISNGNDWTRNTPIIEYPYIQSTYKLYNAEHKVVNVHFSSEKHDYGYSKRVAMYGFFAHHLGLDINKINWTPEPDESFVTILPSSQLRIYDLNHSVPENALKGDSEIMNYLDISND